MNHQAQTQVNATTAPRPLLTSAQGGLLQRKCDCGGSAGISGECEECQDKQLNINRYSTDRRAPSGLLPSPAELTRSTPLSDSGGGAAWSGAGHNFGRLRVGAAPPGGASGELAVSQPGDRSEEEADRAAEQVMRALSSPVFEEKQERSEALEVMDLSHMPPLIQREVADENAPEMEAAPEITIEPETAIEEAAPTGPTGPTGLIVEDDAREVGPGQMRKSEFLEELRVTVCATADVALAEVGQSAKGCPYIDRWIGNFRGRNSQYLERAIRKYAPESAGVTAARDYIPLVAERVRRGVTRWATTGEITEVPEEMANQIPGAGIAGILGSMASAIGGAISGVASGLMGGMGKLFSGIGRLFAKAREGGARSTDNPLAIQSQLRSGTPLDGGVKARMESAFGHDFSRVRVHTDTKAAELSRSLNARAFTIGSDIAFGTAEYKPGTLIGDALVAHELAHVVQQGGAISSSAPLRMGGMGYNALEEDADRSAVGAVASLWGGVKGGFGEIIQNAIPRLRSGLRLQRCPKSPPQVRQPDQPDLRASDRACLTVSSMVAKKTGVSLMSTKLPGFACALSLGEPPDASGMKVESVIDVPSGCEGTLEYVQLVDTCRQLRVGSKDFRRKSSGYILDKQDPWRSVKITSPGNSTFFAKDSPAQPVVDQLTFVSADDKFKTWLLWRPSGETTRIPLAMTKWFWKAKATRTGSSGGCADNWTISDPDADGGPGTATTEMPTWTDTTENLNKSAEPGTCPAI